MRVTAAGETTINLQEFLDCRINRGANSDKPCTLEVARVEKVSVNNIFQFGEANVTATLTCADQGKTVEATVEVKAKAGRLDIPGWKETEMITLDIPNKLPGCNDNSGGDDRSNNNSGIGSGSGSGSGSINCDTLGTNIDLFSASLQESCRFLLDVRHCIAVENDPQFSRILTQLENVYGDVCR